MPKSLSSQEMRRSCCRNREFSEIRILFRQTSPSEKYVQIPASWLNLCDNTFFNRSRMTLEVASGFRMSSTLSK